MYPTSGSLHGTNINRNGPHFRRPGLRLGAARHGAAGRPEAGRALRGVCHDNVREAASVPFQDLPHVLKAPGPGWTNAEWVCGRMQMGGFWGRVLAVLFCFF